jgi:hypothetical protein
MRAWKSGANNGRSGLIVVAFVRRVTSMPGGRLAKYRWRCKNIVSWANQLRRLYCTHLLKRRTRRTDVVRNLSIRHRHHPLLLTLLAIPLFVNFVDHRLIYWRMMTKPMIGRIASVAEDNHVTRRARASQAHLAHCRLGIPAIWSFALVRICR